MHGVDDELASLRRRAYAPDSDIYSDAAALARLVELEEAHAVAERAEPVPDEGVVASDRPEPSVEARAADDEPREAIAPVERGIRMPRVRRSTVIMLSAAALVVACLITALVVVPRVQSDPLQVGATQVARLAPDPSFVAPTSMSRGVTSGVTAYEEFEGFRVITYASFETGRAAGPCMAIWQPGLLEELRDGGYSYNGHLLLQSCGAGLFPPAVTMLLGEETPERKAIDLPAGTAFQFVYDADADEVVVFEG
ncbi:hypothetical protein ACO03V_00405 [Microbacterium sp. HMH0099]|uniref:hypothetical protein n=1 Tax=Microbacterium sp. HMH0099 TaxID=3414026 RepID=UPI003BF66756